MDEFATRQRRGSKPLDQGPGAEGAALAERLERLTAEQRRHSGELEALQHGLQALAVGVPSRPGATTLDRNAIKLVLTRCFN